MIFSEHEKEFEKTQKRMDRLDAVIHEYLRSSRKTVEYLSEQIGCAPSSLWRYSRRVEYFRKMPLDILAGVCRYANISNDDLRFILGLPRGTADEK